VVVKILKRFSILLFFIYLIGLADACVSPEDGYAAEVLLSKPGIKYDL